MRTRRTFRGVTATVSAVILVGTLAGCSTSAGHRYPAFGGSDPRDLTLSVVNGNVEDVRVYILREEMRIPLGTVEGLGSRVFKISQMKLGVRMVLRLGMETASSRTGITMIPVDVEPGQQIEARLGTYLNNSYVFIRSN
jgi:hypothetical protein